MTGGDRAGTGGDQAITEPAPVGTEQAPAGPGPASSLHSTEQARLAPAASANREPMIQQIMIGNRTWKVKGV